MSDVYQELLKALSEEDVSAVSICADDLYEALPKKDHLSDNVVMVAYGGGKDSAYATAFVRALQLEIKERFSGDTFSLRIAIMRHPGMPYSVMGNIHRTLDSLGTLTDPLVETLLIERNRFKKFDRDAPMPYDLVEQTKIDMLMSGHRTYGDGRTTFCTACNFNVGRTFGLAASYGAGVDLIITGDSPSEQKEYAKWVSSLARAAGQDMSAAQSKKGFNRFLTTMDNLSAQYFSEIHGSSHQRRLEERRLKVSVPDSLRFFSIYEHTNYASGDHWDLLQFLGFEFDELAFNFTESDCANPLLMAHLRGLRTENVYGTSYAEGIGQYVTFATSLMRKKEFPEFLVEEIVGRYSTPEGINRMRELASGYAEEIYGLNEEQLICMVFSPFAGQGEHLSAYLNKFQPELEEHEEFIKAALSGKGDLDQQLVDSLESASGLSFNNLKSLYQGPLWRPARPGGQSLNEIIMSTDANVSNIDQMLGSGETITDRVAGR